MNKIPEHITAAVEAGKTGAGPNQDLLKQLRAMVAEARDLEATIASLEEAKGQNSEKLLELFQKKLPDLMQEIGVQNLTLDKEGNYPAIEARLLPYYQANISSKWPEDKRQAAFKWLEKNGHGDLIKTEVRVLFPRGKHKKAVTFANAARKKKLEVIVEEGVHFKTLTAWLKEQFEQGKKLPALDILGATVGKIVRLVQKKD